MYTMLMRISFTPSGFISCRWCLHKWNGKSKWMNEKHNMKEKRRNGKSEHLHAITFVYKYMLIFNKVFSATLSVRKLRVKLYLYSHTLNLPNCGLSKIFLFRDCWRSLVNLVIGVFFSFVEIVAISGFFCAGTKTNLHNETHNRKRR